MKKKKKILTLRCEHGKYWKITTLEGNLSQIYSWECFSKTRELRFLILMLIVTEVFTNSITYSNQFLFRFHFHVNN